MLGISVASELSLVFKFEGFSSRDVDWTTTVGATLLLVLFLGEALATGDRQVLVGTVSIGVGDIVVRRMVVRQFA